MDLTHIIIMIFIVLLCWHHKARASPDMIQAMSRLAVLAHMATFLYFPG